MKITPQDVVLYSGLALTFLNIIDRIFVYFTKAREPMRLVEQRLENVEKEMDSMKSKLCNDNTRIINLEEGGRVLLTCMGALLSHGIDGNNIEEMKKARKELNDYLINK